jgi:hypothetical protein
MRSITPKAFKTTLRVIQSGKEQHPDNKVEDTSHKVSVEWLVIACPCPQCFTGADDDVKSSSLRRERIDDSSTGTANRIAR